MTNNVLIGGGALDYLLLSNGSLVTIQNMVSLLPPMGVFAAILC